MITSSDNPLIQRIRSLQTKRRERERQRRMVIEGVRLLEEALGARVTLEAVLHGRDLGSRELAVIRRAEATGARLTAAAPGALRAASETETPAGLIAIAALPELEIKSRDLVVVADGLQDPGNLGTLLRTAVAAGADAALIMPGSIDVFNPKVVRAGMGAHFQLPLRTLTWPELPAVLAGTPAWLADVGAGPAYFDVDWRAPAALIVSAEAHGPSPEALACTERRVHIPMPGPADSLNAAVAAGVVLFEVARQRTM